LVLEMSAFIATSLELAYKEFRERYMRECGQRINEYLSRKTAVGEEESKETSADATTVTKFYKKSQEMPIIASECPGWVCYAEKRVGDLALPYMSKTKSPQQICGTLSKLYLAKK